MVQILNMSNLAKELGEEIDRYSAKPTKVASKRIRVLAGKIKGDVVYFRKRLVELDAKS